MFWTFLSPLVATGQPQGAEDPHPGDESGKTFLSDMVTWMTTCSKSSKDMSRKEYDAVSVSMTTCRGQRMGDA